MREIKITIQKAHDEEIEKLLNLWIEKSRWLETHGKKLWNVDQFSLGKLKEKYDEPVFYMCSLGEVIIGCFILIEYDRRYWPEQKMDHAFYLHKFMICTGFTGKGYSKVILEWIKDYGFRSGKDFIRLDYDPARPKIQRMYTENGFTTIENTIDETGKPLIKAEYRLRKKS